MAFKFELSIILVCFSIRHLKQQLRSVKFLVPDKDDGTKCPACSTVRKHNTDHKFCIHIGR